jgi:hypothetical protein
MFTFGERSYVLFTVYDVSYRLKTYKYKKFWEELITYFPWYDTGHIENDTSNNSSIVACVFVTTVMFLQSHCLATIGGFLPRHCLAMIGDTHTHTNWWEGLFNYAVEMGSGAMIYVPTFINIGSGIQKIIWGDTQLHRCAHTARWSHKPISIFFSK